MLDKTSVLNFASISILQRANDRIETDRRTPPHISDRAELILLNCNEIEMDNLFRARTFGIVDGLYSFVKPVYCSRPRKFGKPSPGNCRYTSVEDKA